MKAYSILSALGIYRISALLDGDPLSLSDSWEDAVLSQCEALPIGDVHDYLWDSETEGCRDKPSTALCYIARRLSSVSDCRAALEDSRLCALFPDAVTNYCCESVFANASLCPGGVVVGGQGGEGRVNVQAARPYLPQGSERRRLTPAAVVDGSFNKSTLFIFPERLSLCTAAQSAWRIFRLAAMFFDLDSLTGMSLPQNEIFSNGQLWPVLNAAVEGREILPPRRLSEEKNSTETAGGEEELPELPSRSNSTRPPLTIPSPSLNNADSERRFIDQWGPSEPWPPTQRRLRSARRLAECGGMSQLIGELSALASDYFGGVSEAQHFTDRLARLINDNFIVVNATTARLPYKQARAATRYTGLVTPAFVMVPACQPTAVELLAASHLDVDSVAANVPALLRMINAQATEFSLAVDACPDCMEELWAMIVMRANDETGDPRQHHAAMAEGARIKSALKDFHTSISAHIQTRSDAQLPQTIGEALQLAFAFAQKAAGKVAADSASIMEAALLVVDVMQRELSEGEEMGSIQRAIATFIKEDLGCASKKGFQLDGDPDYVPDEEEGGFWFRRRLLEAEVPFRELARMRQQQQVRGVQVVEGPSPTPKVTTTAPIAGSGNLLAAPALLPPISGYKCQDNLPGLFRDYLSLWLTQAQCPEIIAAFGCSAQAADPNILPLAVLLNACPQTWMEMCRETVTMNELGRFLRQPLVDDEFDGLTESPLEWDDDVSSSPESFGQLISQLPSPRAYEPLRQCLDPSYRRTQRQSPEIFLAAAEEEEKSTSTTTPASSTTTTPVSTTTTGAHFSLAMGWLTIVSTLALSH